MKRIAIKHDIQVPGWGMIKEGSQYKVDKFNSRYVYIKLHEHVILRLARKGDCIVLY